MPGMLKYTSSSPGKHQSHQSCCHYCQAQPSSPKAFVMKAGTPVNVFESASERRGAHGIDARA
jgi:hypothetical protein